ncbi:MAG: ECF-type sigma factor [Xanthomonadales bacterium]|nr:ECF-type sigma factor [Xanthomonadales bacterium]
MNDPSHDTPPPALAPMPDDSGETTVALLHRCNQGDNAAYGELFGKIYQDLRRRARRWTGRPDATLSTTALVHETFLSLVGTHLTLNDKAHFFRLAALAMRRLLIDAARHRQAQKCGGDLQRVELDTGLIGTVTSIDMLALDQALAQLANSDPRLAQVVELHFFAGLGFAEIAEQLGLSERTVARDWRAARALLSLAMVEVAPQDPA